MIKPSIVVCLLILSLCQAAIAAPIMTPIIDLEKYMGTWYEIAAVPIHLQKDCFCTVANYRYQNNTVEVTNACRKGADRHLSTASGKGKVVPNSNNAKLLISYIWPFKMKHWILYTDKNYQHAIVGTPNQDHVWILSRTPTITPQAFAQLKQIAAAKGYDVSQLQKTVQSCV